MDGTDLPTGLMALIKSATRELVLASGGVAVVKAWTGLSDGQISRCQGDAYPDVLPTWAVFAIEFRIQKPVFSSALAGLTNHRLIAAEAGEAGDHIADLVGIAQASAATTSSLGAALADQVVTPAEAKAVLGTIGALEDRLTAAKRNLTAVVGGRT